MRYVITENQQEKVIQSLIDNSFDRRRGEINRLWGDMTEEEQEDHFSYHQSLNQIEKLKIEELQTDDDEWTVYLDAYMKSTWNPMDDSYDFDDLFDALGDDLSKFLGVEVFVPLNRKFDYKEGLTEMIKLDIKVGDTIMGGKFKNKKVIVKDIGKNEKGDVTINGKPLLRFRIIKENNIRLRRRESMIKEKLDSIIQNNLTNKEFQSIPFEHFRLHISDYVGTEMADELNLMGDEKVIFRNQIIQYVRNNFYDYLKEVWESKQNINESDEGNNIPSALRFKILKEDNRPNKFQKLIDSSLSILREKCDDQEERGADTEEIVNFEACDELSSTNGVKVVDYKIDKGIIVLFLNFHVESIRHQNIDNLIWELQYQVQTLTGKGSVKLVHNDTINERLNESDEPKHKTVTKFERMLKPALEMLNKMSEGWDVHNYTFDEMSLTDGETTPLSYETNLHEWTNPDKTYNRLHVSSNLLSTMEGFFPLIDEYVIMDWFNEKYNRTATEVGVYDREN
jgi:hypothetical protein